jgi:hypothetical protein
MTVDKMERSDTARRKNGMSDNRGSDNRDSAVLMTMVIFIKSMKINIIGQVAFMMKLF